MGKVRIKRRGNGQGSAVKVKTGNWKAIVTVGYKPDGNPVRRTKQGFATKTEALAYCAELKGQQTKTVNMTLRNAFAQMIEAWDSGEKTKNGYRYAFRVFDPIADENIADVRIEEIERCMNGTEKGTRTKQLAKTALGLVYKWAIPRGCVGQNPMNMGSFIKVRAETRKSTKPAFTADDVKKIAAAAKGGDNIAQIVYCMCYLGLRPGEALEMTKEDLHETKDGRLYFVGGSKTEAGKGRVVPVSPKIEQIIRARVPDGGFHYIFGHETGWKMGYGMFRTGFYEMLERVGVQAKDVHKLTPHSCRHTFANFLKGVKAPDKDKLEIMGHTSSEMLRYYQDSNMDDLMRIAEAL